MLAATGWAVACVVLAPYAVMVLTALKPDAELRTTPPRLLPGAGDELRPEIGLYLQQGPQIRLEFIDFFRNDPSTSGWRGDFGFYVNAALMPVFRRELRNAGLIWRIDVRRK